MLFFLVGIALLAAGCRQRPEEAKLLKEIETARGSADEILIYTASFNEKGKKLSLDKRYAKNGRNFRLLMAEMGKLTNQGVIAKSIPDKQLVFKARHKTVLDALYSSADGRLSWTDPETGKIGTLFFPRAGRHLIE